MDHCLLRGPQNAENLMAALAVGHVLRLPLERMVEPMKTYSAGPHRFEWVAERDGVQFINDSKATNVASVMRSLASFTAPIILIAGGRDKEQEFTPLMDPVKKKVKNLILIGEAN